MHLLFPALLALLVSRVAAAPPCLCAQPSECSPIQTQPPKEVVAFHTTGSSAWRDFAWDVVTTVAVFGVLDPALVCFAHSQGARVVLGADFDKSQLGNATARRVWVDAAVATMQSTFTDGINLDIEGATSGADDITLLTQEAAAAFRAANPGAQVTFDTAIFPDGLSAGYDFPALAAACDFLVPMAYDMDWAAKTASANSPLPSVRAGLAQYTGGALRIPASKLVLGLPWYGYDFPCTNALASPAAPCTSAPGFSGAWSRSFAGILNATEGLALQWDTASESPYASYQVAGGQWHQLWFDDEVSLSAKYELAGSTGVHGVAIWTADMLPYGEPAHGPRAASMWAALRNNFTAAAARSTPRN